MQKCTGFYLSNADVGHDKVYKTLNVQSVNIIKTR